MQKLLFLPVLFMTLLCYSQENKSEGRSSGYQNYTSYAKLIGSGEDHNTFIGSIQMENNYLFHHNFSFGLTMGIEWMDIDLATIGPNIKIILPGTKQQSFYAGLSLGRVIPLEDAKEEWLEVKKTEGDMFYNAELGYVLPTRSAFTLYMALGYRFQEFSYTIDNWWLQEVERSISYNRFTVRIGVRIF